MFLKHSVDNTFQQAQFQAERYRLFRKEKKKFIGEIISYL